MPDFNNVDPDDLDAPDVDPTGAEQQRSSSGIMDMAMSTDPSTPLEQVESPWDPDRGGPTRLMRAAEKAFGTSGMPAILDAVVGLAEIYVEHQGGETSDPTDAEISIGDIEQ